MIEPKELRKGNLVYFDSEMAIGKIVTVATIENEGVRVFNGATYDGRPALTVIIPFKGIDPIIPTEEILLKVGFKEVDTDLCLRLFNDSTLHKPVLHWQNDRFVYLRTWGYRLEITKVASIHLLQNLYFALTRKELEIKLEIMIEPKENLCLGYVVPGRPDDPVEHDCVYNTDIACEDCIFCSIPGNIDPRVAKPISKIK